MTRPGTAGCRCRPGRKRPRARKSSRPSSRTTCRADSNRSGSCSGRSERTRSALPCSPDQFHTPGTRRRRARRWCRRCHRDTPRGDRGNPRTRRPRRCRDHSAGSGSRFRRTASRARTRRCHCSGSKTRRAGNRPWGRCTEGGRRRSPRRPPRAAAHTWPPRSVPRWCTSRTSRHPARIPTCWCPRHIPRHRRSSHHRWRDCRGEDTRSRTAAPAGSSNASAGHSDSE